MDDGGYFINLMNDGSNSNWANMDSQPKSEYELPCDVEVQGIELTRSTYWRQIYEYYHENKTFHSDRSQGSLSHRWLVVQEVVNKLCGYVSQVQNRNQSGTTNEDKLVTATKMYKVMEEKPFQLINCYNLSKTSAKKATTNCTPRNTTTDERKGLEAATQMAGTPLGRKKEKEKKRQYSLDYLWGKRKKTNVEELKKEERYKRAFVMEEKRIKMDRERGL
uniref:No apical meristem-associated C-terminal domain-containing protein n=1 Tax=Leersia perrieri TaxID=77586 RepID=A0A0D9W3G5_9ORYZ